MSFIHFTICHVLLPPNVHLFPPALPKVHGLTSGGLIDFYNLFILSKYIDFKCYMSFFPKSTPITKTLEYLKAKFFFLYFLSFVSLGPHLWHMEVPRLEVESEV